MTTVIPDPFGWYRAIDAELQRAYDKHGREQWGRHEFYAIMFEEVDELWSAIKDDEPQDRVRAEAIQVAAVVIRYLETGDRYREPGSSATREFTRHLTITHNEVSYQPCGSCRVWCDEIRKGR